MATAKSYFTNTLTVKNDISELLNLDVTKTLNQVENKFSESIYPNLKKDVKELSMLEKGALKLAGWGGLISSDSSKTLVKWLNNTTNGAKLNGAIATLKNIGLSERDLQIVGDFATLSGNLTSGKYS